MESKKKHTPTYTVEFRERGVLLRPAMCNPNGRAALARGFGQPVIARISIYLQDAVKAGQEGFSILASAAWRIEINNARRIIPTPGAVIPRQGPEIAGLGLSPTWIKHWCGSFSHEQFARGLQMFGQPVNYGPQMKGRLANPVRHHGAVQINAGSRQDLALTIQMR